MNNVDIIMQNRYEQCPQQNVLSYKNTERFELVNYKIDYAQQEKISVISLLFSGILLEGNVEFEKGDRIIYPIYIDIYVDQGLLWRDIS